MAKGIKGINIEIGGSTTELNKALNSAGKDSYKLQGELKDVNKILKQTDSSSFTLAKQKSDLLKESISATKEKLKVLEEAQKQVKLQFKSGEIDEGQYRAFQREVISTKEKLNSLKDEKGSFSVIGAAVDSAKSSVKDFTDKLEPAKKGLKAVGEAGKAGFKVVEGAVDVAKKGLAAYATSLAGAGTAVTAMTVKAGAAADDINTMATQTGLSTEQIQKFQYASELIDVPMETLTGSMAKLTKNMGNAQGGTGKAAEAFKTLGISITDQNGNLRDNQEVFNEAITKLGQMENGTQRDALAMQMFGKSAQDLNPLILGGADALKQLGDNADNAGLILSQKALNDLNGFNDSVDIMKANVGQAGKVLAGSFAGPLEGMTTAIGSAVPQITGTLANVFSGNNTAESQAKLTSDLVGLVNNLIQQLAANLPTFLAGFNTIIISIVNTISTTLPSVVNTVLPALITGFTNLIMALVGAMPMLLPAIIDGGLKLLMGLIDSVNQIIPVLCAKLPEIIQNITKVLTDNLPSIIQGGFQLLIGLIQGITKCIPQLIDSIIKLIPVLVENLTSPNGIKQLIAAGVDLIVALAVGIPKAIPAIIKALPDIIMAIIDGLMSQDWLQIGIDVLRGIADGLVEGVKAIGNVISDVAGGIVDGFKSFFGINSPSRLFKQVVGKNLALGIGEGFEDEMGKVTDTMTQAVPTDFDINTSVHGSSFGETLKNIFEIPVSVILDGKTVGYSVARHVSTQQGFEARRAFL